MCVSVKAPAPPPAPEPMITTNESSFFENLAIVSSYTLSIQSISL